MPNINKGRLKLGEVIVRQAGNDWPTAQVTYTSDVLEVSSNLYFTSARAVTAVTPLLTTANTAELNSLYYTNSRVVSAVTPLLTTANTAELNSLYYTNSRVVSAVTPLLTTANTAELTNLYYTNSRAVSAVTPLLNTSNVTEGSNLYFTSARAIQAVNPRLTTANVIELTNVYFTNARVVSAISAGNSIIIEANGRISANVTTITLNTSQVSEASANLYFTNTRARAAFTAGRGIIIMSDGTIKSTVGTETFNTAIDGGRSYSITTSMNGITFASNNAADRLVLRSLHITNVSDNTAYVSSNVLYAGGNTAYLANLIPVPVGGIVEFMDRVQLIQPGDTINLQAFNQNQTPANGVLQAYFTYETIISDTTYVGTGHTLATSNANILLVTADQSDTVFESIKFVNLKSYPVPIKTFFGDANGLPKAYLAYNLQIPPNSSVEILQSPKLLKFLDSLYVSYANASNGDAIAVFPSYRRTAVTTPFSSTASAVAQGGIQAAFTTTVADGSTLYYTLE